MDRIIPIEWIRTDTNDLTLIRHRQFNSIAEKDYHPQALFEHIRDNGLIYPIIVTQNYELIDGYRRLSACKRLGHKTILVRIIYIPEENNAPL